MRWRRRSPPSVGPVTLWCAPDATHASFRGLAARFPITLEQQPAGDLGVAHAGGLASAGGLVIGSDCAAFTPGHLRAAAAALDEADVVLIPAEDGGYVLIGMREPHPALFERHDLGRAQRCWPRRARASPRSS